MSWISFVPIIGQIFDAVQRRQDLRERELDNEASDIAARREETALALKELHFRERCYETDKLRADGAKEGE